MSASFNNRVRQVIILAVIILLAFLLLKHLFVFIPGILGAITLYILSRDSYYRLTIVRKWSKGWTAILYIIGYAVIIALPIYLAIKMVSPKLATLFGNPVELIIAIKSFSEKIFNYTGIQLISDDTLHGLKNNLASILPKFLTGTANLISNLVMMFFLLYYLLVNGKSFEKFLNHFIPLKHENVEILATETKLLIRANAIGIPLLAIIQGMVAALGYWIFDVREWGMWGFVTGVCSMIPIVGTGLVWLPLTVYLFAVGNSWQGFGLMIYSLVILTNIDYVARLTLLRKLGDVHPLITIFGVIVGLSMFGFLGLIFGPLLISYFIVLVKIYMNEFKSVPISPMHNVHPPEE
ncbi:MAG: AI-2E family transporter [Chitinophagaceae bacterium]